MAKGIFQISDDFPMAVALGLVKNVSAFKVFGVAESLETDIEKDLTNLPVNEIPLPANAGEALEIVSDNIGDTSTILIRALGPDAEELDPPLFQVVLNGTTPVPIPGLISRINGAGCISDVGFDGTVDIRQAGAGTVFARIEETNQQLNQGLYTIPAGHKWALATLIGTMQKSGGTDTDVVPNVLFKAITQQKWRRAFGFGLQRSGDTSVEFNNKYPESGTGPTDVKISATSSSAGAAVAGRITGLVFKDTSGGN